MNKDFEGLLLQISELENNHRKQEARFLTEQVQHQSTKKELENVSREVEKQKSIVAELKKEIGQAKASLSCEKKVNEQLKQAVRNAKHENQLLREHTNKVVEKMKARREDFLQTIQKTNQSLRGMQTYYSEGELTQKLQRVEQEKKRASL